MGTVCNNAWCRLAWHVLLETGQSATRGQGRTEELRGVRPSRCWFPTLPVWPCDPLGASGPHLCRGKLGQDLPSLPSYSSLGETFTYPFIIHPLDKYLSSAYYAQLETRQQSARHPQTLPCAALQGRGGHASPKRLCLLLGHSCHRAPST